jgi:hypothetical protein
VKKQGTAVLLALCAAASLAAQTDTSAVSLLNVGNYSKFFLNSGGRLDSKYSRVASSEDRGRFRNLGGDPALTDTPLEIALLSTCAGVVDVRPVEASAMLGNPRQADLKLGAAVYQEMQMLRFLGNTDAVGRHEGILKFITDRGNVSGAEIQQYLIDGISAEVDKQFKNISLPPGEIQALKDILAVFFIRPNTGTFNAVRDVEFIYMATVLTLSGEKKKAYENVRDAYDSTISSLSPSLSGAIAIDISKDFRIKSGADNIVALADLVRERKGDR